MIHLCLTCVQTVKEGTQNRAFLRQNCGERICEQPPAHPWPLQAYAYMQRRPGADTTFGTHSGSSSYSHTPGSRPITSIPANTRSPFFMIKIHGDVDLAIKVDERRMGMRRGKIIAVISFQIHCLISIDCCVHSSSRGSLYF